MLESLEFGNFLKFKHKIVEFSPSITTIVGPTGSGKSTILRCLEFVATNRQPRKGTWQKDKSKDCIAKLTIDGQIVTREKGKSNNSYYLNSGEFKAFGTGVPEPIAKLLNVSELNFARQLDNPFWFLDTAGQVSRNLNSIINLEVIDTTLANAASEVRSTKNKLIESQRRLEELKTKKDSLKWIVQVDKDLTKLELLDKSIQDLVQKRSRIENIKTKVAEASKIKQNATEAVLASRNAIQLGQKVVDITDKSERLKVVIKEHERLSSIKPPPSMEMLDELNESLGKIKKKKAMIIAMTIQIEKLENTIETSKSKIQNIVNKMGDVCPLCSRPLK